MKSAPGKTHVKNLTMKTRSPEGMPGGPTVLQNRGQVKKLGGLEHTQKREKTDDHPGDKKNKHRTQVGQDKPRRS